MNKDPGTWEVPRTSGLEKDVITGVQPFDISRPHWKKKSRLGPHTKYIVRHNHKRKSHHVLSKFTILCQAAFVAILSHVQPTGHRSDTPGS